MAGSNLEMNITGGRIQGVAGAESVRIENFTNDNKTVTNYYFYSGAVQTLTPAAGEPIPSCPYPGLAYFGPEDADLFFGREEAVTRLAEAVKRHSFTALLGASGSGKSSVVLAGLAPNLDRSGNWRVSYFRIGTELDHEPFLALARALVPLLDETDSAVKRLEFTKELSTSLRAGKLTLRDVFADCRSRNKAKRILLIADQFEEVFTLVTTDLLRQQFIDVLLSGFSDPAPSAVPEISLILTLRADFSDQALLHGLTSALQDHVVYLGPMKREDVRQAIVRPADNAKVAFDPGLVETLLDAVEDRPGSLPLLQFALREMWARQENRTLTRKSYDAIGGVEGALAKRAETIFAALTKNGADAQKVRAFQRLFTRLVTPGQGQVDTRRVVERQELGQDAWSLAQDLAGENNRLVVTNAPVAAHETAEVVHEPSSVIGLRWSNG
ncbi:MAG: ATP-binding protein [Methylocella sp.]